MEEAFLGGLLHDIGKSVMGLKFPDATAPWCASIYNEDADGLESELELFGFDHAMVGEALLQSWNLARSLENTVRWHHDPPTPRPRTRPSPPSWPWATSWPWTATSASARPNRWPGATQQALAILNLSPETLEGYRLQVVEALEADKDLIRDF